MSDAATQALPKIHQVWSLLPANRREASWWRGLGLFLINVGLWCAMFILALQAESFWFKALWATLTGTATGMLFLIGHDAAHNSLTPHRSVNQVLATLAFLPSLHSRTNWDIGHNRLHHSWTNLRPYDDGYPPLSWAEWQAMSRPRQWLQRFFYTLPGIGFYYMTTVWWRYLMRIHPERRQYMKSVWPFYLDMVCLVAFVLLQITLIARYGQWQEQGSGWALAEYSLLMVWAFIVWNWNMAFVTIMNHTHPKIRWFDDRDEWSFFEAQVRGTTHIKIIWPIGPLFQNIFVHAAHHVDKHIPLYRLTESQQCLQAAYPGQMIVEQGGPRYLHRILQQCQLYDYRNHRWLRFDGSLGTED